MEIAQIEHEYWIWRARNLWEGILILPPKALKIFRGKFGRIEWDAKTKILVITMATPHYDNFKMPLRISALFRNLGVKIKVGDKFRITKVARNGVSIDLSQKVG